MDKRARVRLLLEGLAAGDSLGSTSEFVPQRRMPAHYAQQRQSGWPFRQVGGGMFDWRPGQATDDTDMALCLALSFVERGRFDGEDVANRFVQWMRTGPRDVGGTTARTLSCVARGTPWHESGLTEFHRNPPGAANGSLMRNGVVAGMADDLHDAFRISACQSLPTHYAPLPVICCAAQTYLAWELLEGRRPFDARWTEAFEEAFCAWLNGVRDPICRQWRENVKDRLPDAWATFRQATFDADRFNPFQTDFTGRAGYAVLTLQIAVWAAAWSLRDAAFPAVPIGFPDEVLGRTGPWTLAWVVMVGHDSDTYGATAGPLIAAAHNGLPPELTCGLEAMSQYDAAVAYASR